MAEYQTILDLSLLPEHARIELFGFYEFLSKKYSPVSSKESPISEIKREKSSGGDEHQTDFTDLFGIWSESDFREFSRSVEEFDKIDPEDWNWLQRNAVIMNEIIKKLIEVEKRISSEKGHFSLFALFLPEDAAGGWDVLTAAPWIGKDEWKAMQFLTLRIQQAVTIDELLKFSKVVIIKEDNPGLEEIHRSINVEHGLLEIKNEVFFGLEIKRACFITSRRQRIQEEEDAEMALEA